MKRISKIILTIFLLLPALNLSALEIEGLKSNNVIVYNLDENKVIYEKNADEQVSVASLTKIMTTLVAIENVKNLDEKITITNEMIDNIYWDASTAGFEAGDTVTYKDLLYGIMLPSGADAADSVAISLFGSVSTFVDKMNEKAEELNLKNTHFVNTTGLENVSGGYSSVKDIMNLLKEALENKTFKEIFLMQNYTTTNGLNFKSTLNNYYNRELNYDLSFIKGSKTGNETKAGYCLATLSEINDTEIITVTVKAPTTSYYNVIDTNNIYLQITEDTTKYTLVEAKSKLLTKETKYAKEDNVKIVTDVDVIRLLENPIKEKDIKLKYIGEEKIKYDTKKGAKVGTIEVYYKDELIEKVPALTGESLHFSILAFIKTNIIYIIVGIIILFLLIKAFKKPKRKRR